MAKLWTQEEDFILIELRNLGNTNKVIASKLDRTEAAIKLRCSKFLKEGILENKGNGRYNHLTNDYLLSLIKQHRTSAKLRELSYNNQNIPWPTIMARRFGSWDNAIKLAGIDTTYGMQDDKETTLYLVYFIEENFYKIGITQTKPEIRLKGYPSFNIIDTRLYENLSLAKTQEKLLLSKLSDHRYLPLEFGTKGGQTECFQVYLDKVLNSFEHLDIMLSKD